MIEALTTTLMRGSGRKDKGEVGEMGGREGGDGVAGVRTGMHHMDLLLARIGEGGNGSKTTGIWDMAGGAEDCSVGEILFRSFIQGVIVGI